MRIRPGCPDDIAAVLALGDEAVKWINARGIPGNGVLRRGRATRREAAIRDQADGGGMRIAEDQDGMPGPVQRACRPVVPDAVSRAGCPAWPHDLAGGLAMPTSRHYGPGRREAPTPR